MKPKLLILGHGRHGKDTVAEYLAKHGFTFQSSSRAACEIFLYDLLKPHYGYQSIEQCYEDRHNHRALWYQLICEYNETDPCRLAREILKTSDIYVGMRDRKEVETCITQGLFDLIIWVERDLPLEDSSSFNIDKSITDITIGNTGSLQELEYKVSRLARCLKV
jgi:hypothetical protein